MRSRVKNTINLSKLDLFAKMIFQMTKKKPEIFIFTQIKGCGANDYNSTKNNYKIYNIRYLEYENIIVAEKFIQTLDLDLDDFILSKNFHSKKFESMKWKPHVIV